MHQRHGAAARAAAKTGSSSADAPGVDRAVPVQAGRGGDLAGHHRRQRGLVELEHQLGAGDPAAEVGDVVAHPSASACASSRRAPWSESTRSPRGFSTVAASVHGPATWTLSGPLEALRLLLEHVEVLGEQRPGAAVVDAGRPGGAGEPPARGLQVGVEPGHHRERAAGQVGVRATAGQLGQVRQVGQLAEHGAHRLVEVGARHRPDGGGDEGHAGATRGTPCVALIVQEPTTREPS